MITPPIPANEEARLRDLYAYNILDSEPEQDFTDLVELASYICNTPISLISLIDRNRQWFKARLGISDSEMSRQIAICGYTIMGKGPFIVPDASKDARFADFSTVAGDPHVRFYAGVPLVTPAGYSIGSLCVIDDKPRSLDDKQLKALHTIANQVIKLMEERSGAMRHKERARLEKIQNTELEKLMQTQRRILTILGHDARAPLYAINQMLKLTARGKVSKDELQSNIEVITNQLGATLIMIEDLLSWGKSHLKSEQHPDKRVYPVADIVDEVFNVLSNNAQLKGVSLSNQVDRETECPIPITMMSFMIRNLLNNAIKFTDNGSITVTSLQDGKYLNLTVTDTGKGMSPTQVNHLNNRHSGGTSDDELHDSGIGIMMIQEFMLQLGGTISFISSPGAGTAATLRVPAMSTLIPMEEEERVAL